MADTTPKSYSADPTLYLYTSLTAGSSHIITATSRLETILKANRIPFRALDVATDEKARMLWGRRSKGKKLPGLVRFGSIVGDLDEVEEWNEYGELKQQIGGVSAVNATPTASTANTTSKTPSALAKFNEPTSAPTVNSDHIQIEEPAEGQRKPSAGAQKKEDTPLTMAMRKAGAEAAKKAGQKMVVTPGSLLSNDPTSPDAPAPLDDTKLSKASADPQSSVETTAGKMPMQLAAEGAKRTSVDKIAESESSTDTKTETAKSSEESLLQARRTSSITKTKSALSNETAMEPSPSLPDQQDEERADEHSGSTVSDGSQDEIASIEKDCAIPEEDEVDDCEGATQTEKRARADLASSNKQEQPASEDKAPQTKDPKAGEEAGVSVGD